MPGIPGPADDGLLQALPVNNLLYIINGIDVVWSRVIIPVVSGWCNICGQ
jgi:hypothetical protein